ncbi:MAG: type IX secretion system membrane protein PorP/SprF [Capnocytophaga sp.]|nr:type IX secretion system membrane protein PorP/SprF [Capnocytophaga sp.]
MKILKHIIIIVMLFFSYGAFAQEDTAYYLPYQMPTHTTVKFNSFLTNPVFPLINNYQEYNVGVYYRSQWMGFKNESNQLMGASFGFNWKERNSTNVFIYKRNARIMSNIGVVLNYEHFVELSDEAGLRLGFNFVPMYSGIDRGRVVIADSSDPRLQVKNSFGLTFQPGFDFNIGYFHFGATAENLLDYSLGAKKTMTPFSDKTFTGHLMYRYEFDNDNILERGNWHIMVKATKEPDGLNLSGNVGIDLPKLGWLYSGYTQKYGIFEGIGFNINEMLSIGIEYENGLGAKIPNLGSTVGAYVNYQFGGKRQADSRNDRLKKDNQRKAARLRAEERMRQRAERLKAQPIAPKDTTQVAAKPSPPTPPTPTGNNTTATTNTNTGNNGLTPVTTSNGETVFIKRENIASDKIQSGHYVIIGVYQDPRNAFRLITLMRKKYQVAGFVNPITNRTYVYIGNPAMGLDEAQQFYRKHLYNPDFSSTGMWVLEVVGK